MQTALIAARTVQFWAVALLFGGAGFMLALSRRTRLAVPALRSAALAAAVSGLAWFVIVFVDVTGGVDGLADPEAWSAFFGAPFGLPWLVRLCLCGVALGATALRAPAAFLAVGLLLVLDQAWLGHAANGHGLGAAVRIVGYWPHVLAGFAWVGALTMVCVLAIDDRAMPSDGLALFSKFGVAVVAVLVASGSANALLRGVTPADLATTDYGRLLSAKLLLFAGMATLAVHNRRLEGGRGASRATVGLEAVLGLVVLCVAAALGVTQPR